MTETNRPSCNGASFKRISAVLKWCNYHERYHATPCGMGCVGQH